MVNGDTGHTELQTSVGQAQAIALQEATEAACCAIRIHARSELEDVGRRAVVRHHALALRARSVRDTEATGDRGRRVDSSLRRWLRCGHGDRWPACARRRLIDGRVLAPPSRGDLKLRFELRRVARHRDALAADPATHETFGAVEELRQLVLRHLALGEDSREGARTTGQASVVHPSTILTMVSMSSVNLYPYADACQN